VPAALSWSEPGRIRGRSSHSASGPRRGISRSVQGVDGDDGVGSEVGWVGGGEVTGRGSPFR
jgi:hypothetical protein